MLVFMPLCLPGKINKIDVKKKNWIDTVYLECFSSKLEVSIKGFGSKTIKLLDKKMGFNHLKLAEGIICVSYNS